jgi:hypothetical protein
MAIGSRQRSKSPQLTRFIATPNGTIDDLRQEPKQRQHRLATHGALR